MSIIDGNMNSTVGKDWELNRFPRETTMCFSEIESTIALKNNENLFTRVPVNGCP